MELPASGIYDNSFEVHDKGVLAVARALIEKAEEPAAIGREIHSSRDRFLMPGLRRPVGYPGPVSRSRWRFDFSVADSDGRTVGGRV